MKVKVKVVMHKSKHKMIERVRAKRCPYCGSLNTMTNKSTWLYPSTGTAEAQSSCESCGRGWYEHYEIELVDIKRG